MMKRIIPLLIFCYLQFSCSNFNIDKPVDKSKLTGYDYRLFQGTPAWELAKAVEDEDVDNIASEKPELLNYQEPKYGNTLLILTVGNQQLKSFKALLERKADFNIHNTFNGTSALIEACLYKDYSIKFAEILLKNGANVNDIEVGKRREGNSTRFTPLIAACRTGKLDLVKLLLKNGADINYHNEFDQSALSTAVMQGNYKVAICLLESGADYKHPIFYRPDYSIPSEKQDPKDRGKPMYLLDVLKQDFSDTDIGENKYKIQIIDFLKNKGVNY